MADQRSADAISRLTTVTVLLAPVDMNCLDLAHRTISSACQPPARQRCWRADRPRTNTLRPVHPIVQPAAHIWPDPVSEGAPPNHRQEHQVHEEIETKFGWVRNSAILAAIAPWLLLLILTSQPRTIEAFATDGGKTILSLGLVATALAYLWMERLAKLPQGPRTLSLSEQN